MPGPLGLHPRFRGHEEGNGSRNDALVATKPRDRRSRVVSALDLSAALHRAIG